jgi:hypothetical protein
MKKNLETEINKTLSKFGKKKQTAWYADALKEISGNAQATSQFVAKLSEIFGHRNAVVVNNVTSIANKFRGFSCFYLFVTLWDRSKWASIHPSNRTGTNRRVQICSLRNT